VEAFQPAALVMDLIVSRHPAARVRPADLDAVAAAWTALDLRAARPGETDRAKALADAVLAALLVPAPPEASRAA
jgi:hypothetical protein